VKCREVWQPLSGRNFVPDDGAIAVGLNLILCNLLLEVDAAVEVVGVALPLNEQP